MSPPFVSLSLFVFFLLPFFSSIHYQEGQPVEAQVSPVPNEQALEAAAAATVSGFKNHLMDLKMGVAFLSNDQESMECI